MLVVDDHPLVRRSVEQLLAGIEGIECVATATNGGDAVARAHELAPDVVVMDVSMGTLDGIAATIFIGVIQPETKVVVFTGWGSAALRTRALRAGAVAFVMKDDEPEALVAAIRSAAAA